MKKPYKRVYVEITNRCNLSCSFCIHHQRKIEDLSLEKFQVVLDKLKPYTSYLYFHVLGEPLLHPKIVQFIELASQDYSVNITTNGYFIEKLKGCSQIRQVNLSLHSFDPKYHVSLEEYLEKIFLVVDELIQNHTYVSLRLWTENLYNKQMLDFINERYGCRVCLEKGHFKIGDHLFIDKEQEFIWPDLENDFYSEVGTCYGLRDHFGILVDGTVIPCCLDSAGIISLGNIYRNELQEILSRSRCFKIKEGFQNHRKVEELCKHCSFLKK